mmetsp:Transcript_32601/g.70441  ORF Transcript_32601/g.70441 Transcript_32601/m.70441 type:complete len:288 (-) Transcript_32601:447-1310(-)
MRLSHLLELLLMALLLAAHFQLHVRLLPLVALLQFLQPGLRLLVLAVHFQLHLSFLLLQLCQLRLLQLLLAGDHLLFLVLQKRNLLLQEQYLLLQHLLVAILHSLQAGTGVGLLLLQYLLVLLLQCVHLGPGLCLLGAEGLLELLQLMLVLLLQLLLALLKLCSQRDFLLLMCIRQVLLSLNRLVHLSPQQFSGLFHLCSMLLDHLLASSFVFRCIFGETSSDPPRFTQLTLQGLRALFEAFRLFGRLSQLRQLLAQLLQLALSQRQLACDLVQRGLEARHLIHGAS